MTENLIISKTNTGSHWRKAWGRIRTDTNFTKKLECRQ